MKFPLSGRRPVNHERFANSRYFRAIRDDSFDPVTATLKETEMRFDGANGSRSLQAERANAI
jgi:hypothetical protein